MSLMTLPHDAPKKKFSKGIYKVAKIINEHIGKFERCFNVINPCDMKVCVKLYPNVRIVA